MPDQLQRPTRTRLQNSAGFLRDATVSAYARARAMRRFFLTKKFMIVPSCGRSMMRCESGVSSSHSSVAHRRQDQD